MHKMMVLAVLVLAWHVLAVREATVNLDEVMHGAATGNQTAGARSKPSFHQDDHISSWDELREIDKVLEMAQLSTEIHLGKKPCNPLWELKTVARNRHGKYVASLYVRNDSTCALAFSGSEEDQDWFDDAAATYVNYCGLELIHSGFANSIERFVTPGYFSFMDAVVAQVQHMRTFSGINGWANAHTDSTSIQEVLKDCNHGLVATGHSKGGAMAELFTACSHEGFSKHKMWQGVKVDEVYTFGAPKVSAAPLQSKLTSDGCLPGIRAYNLMPDMTRDPVPNLPPGDGFKHPLMAAMRLPSGSVKPCEDPNVTDEPWATISANKREVPEEPKPLHEHIINGAALGAVGLLTGGIGVVAAYAAGNHLKRSLKEAQEFGISMDNMQYHEKSLYLSNVKLLAFAGLPDEAKRHWHSECDQSRYHEECWKAGQCQDNGVSPCDWCGLHEERPMYCCNGNWTYEEGHNCYAADFADADDHRCVPKILAIHGSQNSIVHNSYIELLEFHRI